MTWVLFRAGAPALVFALAHWPGWAGGLGWWWVAWLVGGRCLGGCVGRAVGHTYVCLERVIDMMRRDTTPESLSRWCWSRRR
jgi:hypothetical protein